ncbi:MAG: ABC transporter permease subunit [Candidatus Thiodiazotropha taylori]
MRNSLLNLVWARLSVVAITLIALPIIPIAAIQFGFTSPEYLHRGILQGPATLEENIDFFQQYIGYARGLIEANSTNSLVNGLAVGHLLSSSLKITGPIVIIAIMLALSIGLMIGITAFLGRLGRFLATVVLFLACVPIAVFAYLSLEWLSGAADSGATKLLVAAILLSFYPMHLVATATRTLLQDLTHSGNAEFLRACGFNESGILLSQAPKPLALKLLTLTYPAFIFSLSFCFFVETPLGIPGFGQRFFNAIQSLDYPVIIAFSVSGFITLTAIELTLAVVHTVLDPRAKHG